MRIRVERVSKINLGPPLTFAKAVPEFLNLKQGAAGLTEARVWPNKRFPMENPGGVDERPAEDQGDIPAQIMERRSRDGPGKQRVILRRPHGQG